jgi:hypothetical protein
VMSEALISPMRTTRAPSGIGAELEPAWEVAPRGRGSLRTLCMILVAASPTDMPLAGRHGVAIHQQRAHFWVVLRHWPPSLLHSKQHLAGLGFLPLAHVCIAFLRCSRRCRQLVISGENDSRRGASRQPPARPCTRPRRPWRPRGRRRGWRTARPHPRDRRARCPRARRPRTWAPWLTWGSRGSWGPWASWR